MPMNNILLGILIPIFLLLTVYPAYALVAGDTISYNFSTCDYLTVNITPCEENEWYVENCIQELTGNWFCDCQDNYQLNLTPAPNCVGEFVITMTSYYDGESEVIRQVFIGGGFIGSLLPKEVEEISEIPVEEEVEEIPIEEIEEVPTEEIIPETPIGLFLLPTNWLVGVISGIIIILCIIYILRRRKTQIENKLM